MNNLPTEKQHLILERFIYLKQLPTLSQTTTPIKKIILLKNIYTQQRCVMKIQPKKLLESKDRNILHEASFLQKLQGHIGIPLMIWSGQDFDCLVLIQEETGYSIYDRMKTFSGQGKMRIKDACMIGVQLIQIVKNLHQKDYLHRNISPETFCFGLGQKITKLYINEALYMRKFRAKNNLNHIQPKQRIKVQFLTPFCSMNVIKNKQPSRRDDMVSIVLVLIYLLKGKLPWQQDWQEQIAFKRIQTKEANDKFGPDLSFQPAHKQNQTIASKIQRRRTIQQSISNEQLCRGLPRQIKQILQLVYELDFTQEPQYVKYQALLRKILLKQRLNNDLLFEWMQSKQNMDYYLKVDPLLVDFQTLKQKQVEAVVFQPYQQKVNLDISNLGKQGLKINKNLSIATKNSKDRPQQQQKGNQTRQKDDYRYRGNRQCQII